MKRIISFIFAISLVFIFTGCDWLRSTLGMPTSEELQRYRQSFPVVADTTSKPVVKDTAVVVNDTLTHDKPLVNTTVAPAPSAEARFYVIAGSFSDAANADKMALYLKESGYTPIRLTFRNGYNVVASSAHKEVSEAYASLRKLLELDFSPEDIWIYDSEKQKLHIQTK